MSGSASAWTCVLGAVALALPSTLHAAPPPSEVSSAAAREPSSEARARLVLLTHAGEQAFALERAIATELNDVEVELEHVPLEAGELGRQVVQAEAVLVEHEALAALWIEPHASGLMIYVVVADAGMLRRPIQGESGEALVEACAVAVRHLVSELLEGGKLGLAPGPASEQPPHPDERVREEDVEASPLPSEAPRGFRLDARTRAHVQFGYAGHAWAPQQRWVSGVEIAIGVRMPSGVQLDLAYALLPRWSPAGGAAADIEVRRFAPALQLGYQHAWDRPALALAAALRFTGEFVDRSTNDPRIEIEAPRLVVVSVLEPRVQLDWLFSPPVSVFVGLGLRVNLTDVDYSAEVNGSPPIDYLLPWIAAPAVYLGLGVFL